MIFTYFEALYSSPVTKLCNVCNDNLDGTVTTATALPTPHIDLIHPAQLTGVSVRVSMRVHGDKNYT